MLVKPGLQNFTFSLPDFVDFNDTFLYSVSVLTGDTLMKYYKYFLADQPTGLPYYISDEFHDDLGRFGEAYKWWRKDHDLSNDDLVMWGYIQCSKEEYDANKK